MILPAQTLYASSWLVRILGAQAYFWFFVEHNFFGFLCSVSKNFPQFFLLLGVVHRRQRRKLARLLLQTRQTVLTSLWHCRIAAFSDESGRSLATSEVSLTAVCSVWLRNYS